MPSLLKNSRSKALLLILNLCFHFSFHIQLSKATLTIDTASLSASDGTIISAGASIYLSSSSAGDFNHDGFEDIIFGMRVSSGTGLTYVIFGTAAGIPTNINLNTLSTTQGIKISLGGTGTQLGASVSALGDINGDLIDDIIIGAFGNSRAYVIFGSQTGLSNIDLSVTDISTTGQGIVLSGPTQLGYQVGSAGDFNNDGINDFMVSAPLASSNQGAVYVIFGKRTIATSFSLSPFTLTASQGIQILGQVNSNLGYSLSSVGDFNNDGINDIMMGTNIPTGGMVAIVYGTSTPTSISDVSNINPIYNSKKGVVITGMSSSTIGSRNSISFAGDLNNDGIDDIALGGLTYSTNVGLTYVIYGKSGAFSGNIDLSSSYNGFQIKGDSSDTSGGFGMALTSADINGDGLSDLIVSSPTATALNGVATGIVYVLFGNSNGFSSAIDLTNGGTASLPQVLMVYGDVTGAQLGIDLSFATDLNKDGVNDLVMQGLNKIYIIYGSKCITVACPPSDASPDGNNLDEIKTINSIKDATNTVNEATLTAVSAIVPQDPGSVTAGMLAKMLQYIKYLNIPYSQRLELTFKDLNSTYGPFGVGPKMPQQAILEVPFHEIPDRFVKFNVHSNFLVNFWDNLIFIALISAALLMIVIAEFGFVQIKQKPAPSILKLVRLNGQNFFMMQFYNVFGDVLLFITLDLRTVTFSSREATISFFVSILFIGVGCIILAFHAYVLIKFSIFRKSLSWTSTSKREQFSKQYEGVDVFFKHFKDGAFINQSFLLLFVIRNCMFNLVLGLLYNSPTLQASLILVMSALMLVYLLFLRSFNTVTNLLQHITCELILLIVNTCVLIMTQLDLTKDNSSHVRDQLSDVVIYTSLVFTFVPPIFLGIKLIVAVVDWHKKKSRKKLSQSNINAKNIYKIKRIRNRVATISQQLPNIINDSSVELNMLQNSFNTNLNDNNSPIIKPLKPNDSPTQKREQFLLTKITSSQCEGQRTSETTTQNPFTRTRGSNQNRLPQKPDRSATTNSRMLGSKIIRNSTRVREEPDTVNANNKVRERRGHKRTQRNIH